MTTQPLPSETNTKRAGRSAARRATIRAIVRGAGLGLLLGCAFAGGFFFRAAVPSLASVGVPGAPSAAAQEQQYPVLAQAEALLAEHYLRDLPDRTALEYGAIRGLLGTLNDRLTYFIDPPVAASEGNVLAGAYGGIGVQVKRDEAGRFALYPFRDGPAARAGVRDGDILLTVNNVPVAPETGQDAVDQLLRGEVKDGNGVTIGVRAVSDGVEGEERTYTIPFETIEVPSVVWRRLSEEPTFGYIQILRFTSRTPDELRKAIAELRSADGGGLRAVVLDLRNNPGGLLQESVDVANEFLAADQVVLYEQKKDGEKIFRAAGGGTLTDLPLIAIVNGGTASASELVAAALKDQGRAQIIGQPSFGKGTVQLIFQLLDKSSLHVTTAEFLPPNRGKLEGVGVQPDISMIPDSTGRDVELGEAIRRLRDRLAQG